MIREDRELLAELARVNSDAAPLAMRVMDDSATADEQYGFAERLIQLGERFKRRARQQSVPVVEGEVVADVDVGADVRAGVSDQEP
ncbi:MAG: hypothetical protein ACRDT0_24225 [Pseudonocardiaceae bacterium]